jgi:hypothetical protein
MKSGADEVVGYSMIGTRPKVIVFGNVLESLIEVRESVERGGVLQVRLSTDDSFMAPASMMANDSVMVTELVGLNNLSEQDWLDNSIHCSAMAELYSSSVMAELYSLNDSSAMSERVWTWTP